MSWVIMSIGLHVQVGDICIFQDHHERQIWSPYLLDTGQARLEAKLSFFISQQGHRWVTLETELPGHSSSEEEALP